MLFLGIQDPPVLVRLQISPLSHVPLGADVPVKQDNLKMSLQFTIGNNNFSYLHPPSTGVWTLRGYLVEGADTLQKSTDLFTPSPFVGTLCPSKLPSWKKWPGFSRPGNLGGRDAK